MASGLDQLFDFVLGEIALCGSKGAGSDDFRRFIQAFYDRSRATSKSNPATEFDSSRALDRPFHSKIWDWIIAHEDVRILHRGEARQLSLSDFEQLERQESGSSTTVPVVEPEGSVQPEIAPVLPLVKPFAGLKSALRQHIPKLALEPENLELRMDSTPQPVQQPRKSASDSIHQSKSNPREPQQLPDTASVFEEPDASTTAPRLFATQNRMWLAITGHGIDFKKVPKMHFTLLSIIASRGPDGIAQPELVKISGQDKRSVPKRTDDLASKGYIEKKPVQEAKMRTSLCVHTKFLTAGHFLKEPNTVDNVFKDGRFIVASFVQLLYDFLKDKSIVPVRDLRKRMGVSLELWNGRGVRSSIIRLDESGFIKRIRVRRKGSQDRWVTCIKLLREPKEDDLKNLKFRRAVSNDDAAEGILEEDEEGDAFMRDIEIDLDNEIDAEQDNNEMDEIVRIPPQWTPERPLANLVFEIVESAGTNGGDASILRDRSVGKFWKRAFEAFSCRVTDDWEQCQPYHLRHLAILRDTQTTAEKKFAHYVYRSFHNFKEAVNQGDVLWEGVSQEVTNGASLEPSSGGKTLNPWGFEDLDDDAFHLKTGSSSLTECCSVISNSYGHKICWDDDATESKGKNLKVIPRAGHMAGVKSNRDFSKQRKQKTKGLPVKTKEPYFALLTKEQRIALGLPGRGRLGINIEQQIRDHRKQTGDPTSLPTVIHKGELTNRAEERAATTLLTMEERAARGLPVKGRLSRTVEKEIRKEKGMSTKRRREQKQNSEPALLTKQDRINRGLPPVGRLPTKLVDELRRARDADISFDSLDIWDRLHEFGVKKQISNSAPQEQDALDEQQSPRLAEHEAVDSPVDAPEIQAMQTAAERPGSAKSPKGQQTPETTGEQRPDSATTYTTKTPGRDVANESMENQSVQASSDDVPVLNADAPRRGVKRVGDQLTTSPNKRRNIRSATQSSDQLIKTSGIVASSSSRVIASVEGQSSKPTNEPSQTATTQCEPSEADIKIRQIKDAYENRSDPGVYLNPLATRKIGRGRPRKACIMTFKSPRLRELTWFQPDPVFANTQMQTKTEIPSKQKATNTPLRATTETSTRVTAETPSRATTKSPSRVATETPPRVATATPLRQVDTETPLLQRATNTPSRATTNTPPRSTTATPSMQVNTETPLLQRATNTPSRAATKTPSRATTATPSRQLDTETPLLPRASQQIKTTSVTVLTVKSSSPPPEDAGSELNNNDQGAARENDLVSTVEPDCSQGRDSSRVYIEGKQVSDPGKQPETIPPNNDSRSPVTITEQPLQVSGPDALSHNTPTPSEPMDIERSPAPPRPVSPGWTAINAPLLAEKPARQSPAAPTTPSSTSPVPTKEQIFVEQEHESDVTEDQGQRVPSTASPAPSSPSRDLSATPTVKEKQRARELAKKRGPGAFTTRGVVLGRGSVWRFRTNIIREIIDLCHGVFPANGEIWSPFCYLWASKGPKNMGRPDRSTLVKTLAEMIKNPEQNLQRMTVVFLGVTGATIRRSVVAYKHMNATAPEVVRTVEGMKKCFPGRYYPPEVAEMVTEEKSCSRNPVAPVDETVQMESTHPESARMLAKRIRTSKMSRKDQKLQKKKEEEEKRKAHNEVVERAMLKTSAVRNTGSEDSVRSKRMRLAGLSDTSKSHQNAALPSRKPLSANEHVANRVSKNVAPDASDSEDDTVRPIRLPQGPLKPSANASNKDASPPDPESSSDEPLILSRPRIQPAVEEVSSESEEEDDEDEVVQTTPSTSPTTSDSFPTTQFYPNSGTFSTNFDFAMALDRLVAQKTHGKGKKRVRIVEPLDASKKRRTANFRGKWSKYDQMPDPTLLERLTGLTGDPNDPIYQPPTKRTYRKRTSKTASKPKKKKVTINLEALDPVNKFKRICCTLVVASCLSGEDDVVDWDIVAKASAEDRDLTLPKLKKTWTWIKGNMSTQLAELNSSFQTQFLEAYENGEVASIEDVETHDWAGLVKWAVTHCDYSEPPLPLLREALSDLIVDESDYQTLDRVSWYRVSLANYKRAHQLRETSFAIPLHESRPSDGSAVKARSWIRSNTATPQAIYDGNLAHDKMRKLETPILERSVLDFVDDGFLRMRKIKRLLPGRNYNFTAKYARLYRRTFQQEVFMEAVQLKKDMDVAFANEGAQNRAYPLSRAADDGAVMAIMSLLADSRIRLVPRLPPINNEFDAPHPRFSVWGFCAGDYLHRRIDRQCYFWPIDAVPTANYEFGHPLQPSSSPLCPPESGQPVEWPLLPDPPLPGKHDADAALPIWSSIDGQTVVWPWWYRILNLVIQPLVFQPGSTAETIFRLCPKHTTERFEVQLVLDWLESVRAAKKAAAGTYEATLGFWAVFGDHLIESSPEEDWFGVHVMRKKKNTTIGAWAEGRSIAGDEGLKWDERVEEEGRREDGAESCDGDVEMRDAAPEVDAEVGFGGEVNADETSASRDVDVDVDGDGDVEMDMG